MRKNSLLQFHSAGILEWEGRYNRIAGDLSVFHVVRKGRGFVIQALVKTWEGKVIYEAVPNQNVKEMTEAINEVKSRHNGQSGGSFLLNEFGQVLVPTISKQRFCVGHTTGVMLLRNLDTQDIIDLSNDTGLETGDPWELPYVGMVYNLNGRSQLYYWNEATQESEKPPAQDRDLIAKIRSVRRSGSIRLVVNPYGVVSTKVPRGVFDPDEDTWEPVYIGRVDYNKWFAKEDVFECQTGS
ncbi:MAG TPA: hypothetical protein DDW87_00290 [Firmicutes bacterium]|nr:hypothetical protein [Bacillota bacterium]